MHLETSSLESSTRVYPFDNVGLRPPTSTFGNTPSNNTSMYGLSPYSMFNQYTNPALWKTTINPVDDYSKSMLKSENILFGNSADDFYSTQSLFKTFDEHAEKSELDDASKNKSEQISKNSEISLTIDQTSTISTPEQVSPSPSSEGSSQSGTLKKKARTVFTNNQLRDLQATFAKKKYLTTDERMKLAAEIGLSHTKIKTWFQNRRMKWKRVNHCTVPGLIPTMPQDCLPQPHTSTMLAMSNLPAVHPNLGGIPNVPVQVHSAPASHLQMSTSLQTTTSSCLPQAMYSQTFTNGYYSMNNSMLGHSMSSSQNLFNSEFTKYSPLPPNSVTDTPTYDTSYMGYPVCSKYPYHQSLPTSLPTYTNRDNLLMVAPPTQSYLPL